MNLSFLYAAGGIILVYLLMQRFAGPRPAAPAEVLAKIKAGARVIDVRTPGEFSSGAYRKAKNIPLDELPRRLGDLGPKDKPIVLYCASGARSSRAARMLKSAGFTDIVNAGALGAMPRS